MEWLISFLITLSGITITKDGYIIDRQQKELEKLDCVYWSRECADKIKHNKKFIYFEDVKNKGRL